MRKNKTIKYSIGSNSGKYKRVTLKSILINNGIALGCLMLVPLVLGGLIGLIYIFPTWIIYHFITIKIVRNIISLTYMYIIFIFPIVSLYLSISIGVKKICVFKEKRINIISILLPIITSFTILYIMKDLILSLVVIFIISSMYIYLLAKRYYTL